MAPHLHGRASMMEQGGQTPVWHGDEQTWEQLSSGRMHVELHVGMGSEQEDLTRFAFAGKKAEKEGSRACFPHGQ
jgi:hypothetical protein